MTDWVATNTRLLEGIERCDPLYRPTNFWQPGLRRILADLESPGFSSFKSWPSGDFWFYPKYGLGLRQAEIKSMYDELLSSHPALKTRAWSRALNGFHEARRDFDSIRLGWDQQRWPFDLESYGEDTIGEPPQRYRLTAAANIRWGRPYLNYLLCLSALSRHVETPPRSFLEIGGGFGVLGEIVMQRDTQARYVDLDIPPLLTVAAYYLTSIFGRGRVLSPDEVAGVGPIVVAGSGCVPNWRIPDLEGPFDVFVNSYSFQEMEPDVVANYVAKIADIGVTYVVSLNSRRGKPWHAGAPASPGPDETAPGVLDAVTSERIVAMFEEHGYSLQGRYGAPLLHSAGELIVLERS